MSLYRFYIPALTQGRLPLPDDQAHHAQHVLRLEPGTPVILFDGRGTWAEGTLHPHKRESIVEIAGEIHHDPAPAIKLTLAVAVPKADRAEWLVEQASQLGVSTIQWLDTDRGVVKPKESGGKIEKFRKLAIESAKQCARTHIMTIESMRKFEELLANSAGSAGQKIFLDPRAEKSLAQIALPPAGEITAFIGPEGGFSSREEKLIRENSAISAVRLTPTILRIETAAAAVAAIIMSR